MPAGTITMLFSDIERSTALLNRLGDRYGEALSAQRAVLRTALRDCGGQEMGTEGDSFFVVFASAGCPPGCRSAISAFTGSGASRDPNICTSWPRPACRSGFPG